MSYDPTHDETGNIFEVLFPFHDIDYGELRSVHGYSELENDPMFRTNRSWNFLASWTMKEERLKRRRTRKLFGLYMFPNLPLDLILEILTHLHPLDLYNVARANKALRALLLTRNASYNVWKTAFERHPSLPRCPPDLSEPCWTTLLFGPVICDECGRHGALVNFAYRRHFCSKCFASRSLFTIQGASDRLYEESNIVWQLVPYTIADNSHSFSTRSFEDRYPFYFKRPLDAIALATEALRKSADQGEAEAEKALETFVTMRQEQAARLVQQEEEVIDWGGEIYSEIVDELAMKHQNLMRQIKLRLIEEGHDRRDINLREPCYEFARNFSGIQLTSFVWKKVRPLAEAKITENRETRLAAESRHRPSIIEQVYCQYQKTVSPKLWKYLPSSCNLLKYDLISALATSSSDSTLKSSTYADVIAKLPVYIADWQDWHRKELLKAMPNTSDIDLDDLALSKSKLGLSTSVFTCMRCKPKNLEGSCFVGGEAVEAHVRCGGLMAKFEYNAIGSGVAAELAELLQLDPSDTTVGDMDRLDARFLCGNCPLEVYRGARGHKVFTWRECIAHANYMHVITDPAHLQSFWYLLTPEATDIFRHHERQYPHPFDDAWSCTHCSIHFSNYVNRQKALDHVKNAHSIPAPKEDVDFFYDPSPDARLTPRRPAVLREAPLAQYRCKLCSRLFYRLFSLRSLEQHLMHKHRITSPVPDEHFTHVKLVGASLYY